jgi:osmoprotectant transport system ATP-binding protein
MTLSSPNASAPIRFDNVSYVLPYSSRTIVDGLNFTVNDGEILVLLGESGCGKTTTLRLINALLQPTSGAVFVNGNSTATCDEIALRRGIGYVIQEGGLFPHFSVEKNIGLVPGLKGESAASTRERAREMLQLVGLDGKEFAERFPHELSGGQRQRVGVARALAADAPLLLMDEPFGALDSLTRVALQREFADLCQRLQKTVVLVTHDVREALILGTRIALMRAGKIVLMTEPNRFFEADDADVRAYQDAVKLPVPT